MSKIQHVYYINLETRSDRKDHVEQQLRNVGLEGTRFDAIRHEVGAIGCTMSHLELLRMAKRKRLDHIMIVEDDILFLNPEVFQSSMERFLASERPFDVLLLAGNNMGPFRVEDDTCVQARRCFTTTGYLVREAYYDRLIDNIEKGLELLQEHPTKANLYAIDVYWTALQQQDVWYLLTPLSVIQMPDYSDIEQKQVNYSNLMLNLTKPPVRAHRRSMFMM